MDNIYLFHSIETKIYFNEEGVYINEKNISHEAVKNSLFHQSEAIKILREHYREFLKKYFRNIVVLSAAGSSMDNGEHSGKDRIGLWNSVAEQLKDDKTIFNLIEFGKITKFFNGDGVETTEDGTNLKSDKEKDIEALLSKAHLAIEFIEKENKKLVNTKKKIEEIIKKECTLNLSETSKHKLLLHRLCARSPKDNRLKLFTTNYDTLFEQAASKDFVIVDGFSYNMPRTFNGRFFDWDFVFRLNSRIKNEENFVPNVFHLYKLHGSINWDKEDSKIIISQEPKNPLIIYPASNKYESSFEQPYFEMMSRFQQEIRKEDVLLIVLGFSFYDKHLRNVIKESVEGNPSFRMLVVNYNGENEGCINGINPDNEYLKYFINKPNVYLIDEKFSDFATYYPINETYYDDNGTFEKQY